MPRLRIRFRFLHALALIALAHAACPQSARAQDFPGSVALRWDHCYGDGGTTARSFSCDTNSGSNELVVSAYPAAAVPQLNGADVFLQIDVLGDALLPGWWQLWSGGCRGTTALTASFVPPAGTVNCLDPWAGQASGGVIFDFHGDVIHGQIHAICAIPQSVAIPAGAEVFIARIVVLHLKTVGAGSCTGCLSGACIGLKEVALLQPSGVGDFRILFALPGTNSDVAAWQVNAVQFPFLIDGPGPGALEKLFGPCTAATAAARTTWGAVKQLYR